MGDKETLERLKAWAQIEHWTADGSGRLMIAAGRADELSSDLNTGGQVVNASEIEWKAYRR